jgi:hypothetical protein
MFEDTKKKSIDKSPIRIRPPDERKNHAADAAWSDSLTLPQAEPFLPRWLSVEQVRKMQRMRRGTVIRAMQRGELRFEQRGRIRYARLSDVLAWEERRLKKEAEPPRRHLVHPDLAGLV